MYILRRLLKKKYPSHGCDNSRQDHLKSENQKDFVSR